MNIHEYQAKALLKSFGIPWLKGGVAYTVDEAMASPASWAARLGGESQIHAGGRGKGKFKELGRRRQGRRAPRQVRRRGRRATPAMLGNTLVTKQTGPAGKQVNRLYIEDGSDIARELYLSLLVDRATAASPSSSRPKAAWTSRRSPHDTPEKIVTFAIDPPPAYQPSPRPQVAFALKLTGGAQVKQRVAS
jgi:succinyl-CoA synthetase beta subunit